MNDEQRTETVDSVVTAVEKHQGNYEVRRVLIKSASKFLKELLDKKCGSSWNVIVGEGYAFDVTFEEGSILYCFMNGMGVLLWKVNT
jgi:dynein light chain 4